MKPLFLSSTVMFKYFTFLEKDILRIHHVFNAVIVNFTFDYRFYI